MSNALSVLEDSQILGQFLTRDAIPLYSIDKNLALLWTGKAGCTIAMRWFLFQIDKLEELRAYDPSLWPHDYRFRVFMTSPRYREGVKHIFDPGMRCVKFVRDPYQRCVSSYLTFCQVNKEDRWSEFGTLRQSFEQVLRHSVKALFSFREFVSFLANTDLDFGDVHLSRQVTLAEREGLLEKMHIIRIERLEEELPVVEKQLLLKDSALAAIWMSGHHSVRKAKGEFVGDCRFTGGQERGRQDSFPVAREFYDGKIFEMVTEVYRADIERYGYEWSLKDIRDHRSW